MGIDIRLPMGVMFAILGAILAVFGLISPKRSLDININLWWGLVMLAFGGVMLLLTWRAAKNPPSQPPHASETEPPRQPGH